MIRSLINLLVAYSLVLAASACGGSAPGAGGSPTGPSGSSGAVASGAVISGTVIGRTLSAATLGPTLDGVSTLTVTVAGTSLTVTVDATGHFELSGVPAGNIELLFRDGSSTWTVVIEGVAAEEQIQIQINMSSGTPKIVSESRSTAKVRLCHRTEANRYQPIEISVSAEATHRAHGDAASGEPVPADTTKIFDANCRLFRRPFISSNRPAADASRRPAVDQGRQRSPGPVVTNHGLVSSERSRRRRQRHQRQCGVDDALRRVDDVHGDGVAVAGQYVNVGTATALSAGVLVSHSDPSHYFGEVEDDTDGPSGPKVQLCHKKGKGRYQLISVGASAEPAHRAHGDAKIGEPVPLEAGKIFGPACTAN
jgi:hypothetical protein